MVVEIVFQFLYMALQILGNQTFLILKTAKYARLHTQSSKVSTVLGKSVFSLFV